MVRAVIFDMYETLITLWHSHPYMGREIASDAGIPESVFREIWDASDDDRAVGKRTFEDVIEEILIKNDRFSEDLFDMLVRKRKASKTESFEHMHKGVIPMLDGLKAKGIKIGLITNCFLEEKEAIESSILFPYFDAVCMSCEIGLTKPDIRIFEACLDKLELRPEECIYCGDGGSNELQTAEAINMKPVQALWYLKEGVGQPVGKMPGFPGAEEPADILRIIDHYQENPIRP